jgi:hypothetical protein
MLKWILRYTFRSQEYVYSDVLIEVLKLSTGLQEGDKERGLRSLFSYLVFFRPKVGKRLYKFLNNISWEKS